MKLPAIFTSFLLSLPVALIAQPKPYPDSIRIELPDQQSIVVFELRRYTDDKALIQHFPSLLSELLNQIQKSIPQDDLEKQYDINVTYPRDGKQTDKQHIQILRRETHETSLTVIDGNLVERLTPGWELTIRSAKAVIYVYSPDFVKLKEIASLNFDRVVNHLDTDKDTHHLNRMGTISRTIVSNNTITPAVTSHRLPEDMLGLHPGAGIGLLQDKWYPEFNLTIALYFSNRFKSNRQRLAASYELKLFGQRNAEGVYRTGPATFLSLSYGLNFAKEGPRWTALGLSYLVHNKSDLFTGNTMKIFLETDIGSQKLNIIPELYLTDDFKKTSFGLKLNYRF